ncbi:MAG: prepilin-type N-terminal cleavage/methylation domain-containing protein, partial [Planctomycetota bacterium]
CILQWCTTIQSPATSLKLQTSSLTSPAFTLVELLVVITLMSLAVGVAVFRMDGFSDSANLRSAANQLASWVRLTQTQARTSGQPRLLEYGPKSCTLRVQRPYEQDGAWSWQEGAEFSVNPAVHLRRVLVENDFDRVRELTPTQLVVGPSGHYPAHAVLVDRHDVVGVLLLAAWEEPRFLILPRMPSSVTLENLRIELESLHVQSSGADPH